MTPLVGIPQPMDAQGRYTGRLSGQFSTATQAAIDSAYVYHNLDNAGAILAIGQSLFSHDDDRDREVVFGIVRPTSDRAFLVGIGLALARMEEHLRKRRVRKGERSKISAIARLLIHKGLGN